MTTQLPLAQRLEPRLLLANQYVGDTFTWNGENEGYPNDLSVALHPNGYWVTAVSGTRSTLTMHDLTGAAMGSAIDLHSGEQSFATGFNGGDRVSTDSQGNAVVVWVGRLGPGYPGQITFQLFDSVGQARTQPRRVFPERNYQGQGDDIEHFVDMNENGSFVVSWKSQGTANNWYARLFDASGNPKSPAIGLLPPYPPASGYNAVGEITALNDGGFMVQNGTRRVRYSAAGTMVGQPVDIIPSNNSTGHTATDSSGRTVAWWRVPDVPNNGLSSIYMETFDIAGVAAAPAAVVGKIATFGGSGIVRAGLDDDRIIFSWPRNGVMGRQMRYDGTPIGVNFKVNRSFNASSPSFILFHPDSYLIGFDGSDGTAAHRYAQTFDDDGPGFSASLTFELNGYDARCSFGIDPRCYHQLVNATFNTPVMFYTTTTSAHGVRIKNLDTNSTEVPLLQRSADGLSMKILPAAKFVADGNYRVTVPRFEWGDALGNAPDADLSLDYFFLSADLNFDKQVSISDFIQLASNYEKTNAIYIDGDVNYDGTVSIADFITLASRLGRTLPAPAAPQAAASSILSPSDDQEIVPTHKNRRRHHHRIRPEHSILLRVRD